MENSENLKTSGQTARRIVISVFCAVIAICVAYVLFFVYNPSQNALAALSSVCMDTLCIVILIIIISNVIFGHYGNSKTSRLFALLLVASVWAMFMDFLNWAFDGSLTLGHLTYWFTVLSLCMGSVLAMILCLYLYSYMKETHNLIQMKVSAYVCAVFNFISFILAFVLALTGTAFEFVDGHYTVGNLYSFVEAIPVVTLLFIALIIARNVKRVGLHDVLAVIGYILFMIAGALIEAEYVIGTTYVAVALADIYIFVMLQNELIASEKRKALSWMAKSTTDSLTGCYNRHAYEADLKLLEGEELRGDFVYVSMDVNSLKVINDSFGHSVGDELLVGAAECLEKCFNPYGKFYRMGGDEFIALIYADDEHLAKIKNNLEEATSEWSDKAGQTLSISCGYVTRREARDMTLRQMAILADKRMYEAKDEFYHNREAASQGH